MLNTYRAKFRIQDGTVKDRRYLTDSPDSVRRMLVENYGKGNVVLYFIELETPPRVSYRTCACCGQTREMTEREGQSVHPAELESGAHLRELL